MLSQSFLFFYRKALKCGVKLFFLHHYFKPLKKIQYAKKTIICIPGGSYPCLL